MKDKIPKEISRKILLKVKRISLIKSKIKFPNGTTVHYTVEFPDAAIAVVIDRKKNVYLAKEWRSGWNRIFYKLPGGIVEGKGEAANRRAVRREILEELGVRARKITKLIKVPDDVWVLHHFHIYLAEDISIQKQKLEKHEHIQVVKMPLKKALKIFTKPNVSMTSESVLGLLLAKERLKL